MLRISRKENMLSAVVKLVINVNLVRCNYLTLLVCSLALMLVVGNSISAQQSITPAGNALGSPAGSYLLSDIESVSLYSGKVNTVVPLVKVGGRGNAGYQIVYPIKDAQWTTYNELFETSGGSWLSLIAVPHPDEIPNPNRTVFLRPFEFGTVSVKYSGSIPGCYYQGNADYPTCYQTSSIVVVFTSSDGTEHALYDEKRGGLATGNCYSLLEN